MTIRLGRADIEAAWEALGEAVFEGAPCLMTEEYRDSFGSEEALVHRLKLLSAVFQVSSWRLPLGTQEFMAWLADTRCPGNMAEYAVRELKLVRPAEVEALAEA